MTFANVSAQTDETRFDDTPSVWPEAGLSTSIERHLRLYFAAIGPDAAKGSLYDQILREVEGPLLRLTLAQCSGNQLRAAALLGLNRNTLRKKLRALGLLASPARAPRRRSRLTPVKKAGKGKKK